MNTMDIDHINVKTIVSTIVNTAVNTHRICCCTARARARARARGGAIGEGNQSQGDAEESSRTSYHFSRCSNISSVFAASLFSNQCIVQRAIPRVLTEISRTRKKPKKIFVDEIYKWQKLYVTCSDLQTLNLNGDCQGTAEL